MMIIDMEKFNLPQLEHWFFIYVKELVALDLNGLVDQYVKVVRIILQWLKREYVFLLGPNPLLRMYKCFIPSIWYVAFSPKNFE